VLLCAITLTCRRQDRQPVPASESFLAHAQRLLDRHIAGPRTKPLRQALPERAQEVVNSLGDDLPRNPITGIPDACCAPTASGQAAKRAPGALWMGPIRDAITVPSLAALSLPHQSRGRRRLSLPLSGPISPEGSTPVA